MKMDFVPEDVRSILSRVDQTQAVLQQVLSDLSQRAKSQATEAAMFEKSTKSFTSLEFALGETTDSAVANLAELYDFMSGVSSDYSRSLSNLHDSLASHLEIEHAELAVLRSDFHTRAQHMHIARSEKYNSPNHSVS